MAFVCCLPLAAHASQDDMGQLSQNQAPSTRKSIGDWVSCGGRMDDSAGVAKAFAAARHGAFTIVVDCPVRLDIGSDISRSIFIDDGTTVEFTPAGRFIVDNLFIPAFVIANSSDITLTNWNVEYDASLPITPSPQKPGNAFNDVRLTHWLTANRGINFGKGIHSQWTGTTNACAIFFITGDSSRVTFTGTRISVPAGAGGDRFVPVAFALGMNFKNNQTLGLATPMTSQYFAVPHGLQFKNIFLDGTYMGWVGGLQDAVFDTIQSERYGDVQDAQGEHIGGVGKWFAPPHLFYLNYASDGDPGLFNRNITIKNVIDHGIRAGKARDGGPGDSLSGYANSLKLGCVDCSVDNYSSARPDGVFDIITSDNLTISNVTATYNSAYLNNVFPGWRFPSNTYKNVRFINVTLIDQAEVSAQSPIGNAAQDGNQGIIFKNVHIEVNRWAGSAQVPLPVLHGRDNDVSMDYFERRSASTIAKAQSRTAEVMLQATPVSVPAGAAVNLTWSSRQAAHCTASGAWSGDLATSGSRIQPLPSRGKYEFGLACGNDRDRATTTVRVDASPKP